MQWHQLRLVCIIRVIYNDRLSMCLCLGQIVLNVYCTCFLTGEHTLASTPFPHNIITLYRCVFFVVLLQWSWFQALLVLIWFWFTCVAIIMIFFRHKILQFFVFVFLVVYLFCFWSGLNFYSNLHRLQHSQQYWCPFETDKVFFCIQ